MVEIARYVVVATVILAPMFIMADELDGDEFEKSAVGLVLATVILSALHILERQFKKRNGGGGDSDD